ncbi:MAG: hypothetical protein ACRERC_20225 [Candidatus Binatia bacterium]
MIVSRPRLVWTLPLLALLAAGCGDSATLLGGDTFSTSAPDAVEVSGHLASAGTRGSVLVYAFVDLPAGQAPAEREAASLATVGTDGTFLLSVPPNQSLTLVFLADGANDGVIDGGDPIVVLTDAKLAALQVGDVVQIGDITLDFGGRKATVGSIEVQRAGEPPRTPTPVPAA